MISTSITNEELLLFYDLSNDLFCTVDKNGYIKNANKAFIKTSGYTEDELQSSPLSKFIHPEEEYTFSIQFSGLHKKSTPVHFECRLYKKDGTCSWLAWTIYYHNKYDAFFCVAKETTEMKMQASQLSVTKNNLTSVLENIGDAFITVDNKWVIRYWNKQAEKLLGKDRQEVVGRIFWEIYPAEIRKGFYQQYHRAFRERKPIQFEEFFPNLNTWLEVSAYPSEEGLTIYFKDSSDRKRKEKEYKEVNERYQMVSKATSEVIWDWDIEKNTIFWHGENYKKQFGYNIVNTNSQIEIWEQNIHPDDKTRVLERLTNAINNNQEHWQDQYWFKKVNGEYAYVNDRAYIVRNEAGKAIRLIGSMDDITPQRLAEDALAKSEKDYKTLFNNAPLPKLIFDLNSLKFLNANDAALKHYGYSIGEFLQMTVMDIRPPKDIERAAKAIKQFKKQKEVFTLVSPHTKKNGEEFIADIIASHITYKGKPSVLMTINDVTKRIELEERVSRLKVLRQKKITQATISGQEKERQYIGKELHDNINQVLTTTKLYLEFAEENEEMRVSLIEKSKNNLIKIINDIRALCKSLIPPTIEDIGLIDAIQELIESLLVTRKFKIHFTHSGNIDPLSQDIKITLFRVIQEQLNNIIKYADAKNIWIDLKVNGKINLIIKDDGRGFDTAAKRKGVGLSNIKNRADLYNGLFIIDSNPGEGSLLKFQIPLTDSLSVGMNILIVEDNEDDQEFLKEAFDEVAPHHHLMFMSDGRKMIDKLQTIPDEELPSLIILDYNLPGLNGIEMLKLLGINQRVQNIPKIVYTTASHNRYKEQSYSANATAYIEKGFTLEEIKDNVRQMLSFAVK